MTALIDPFYLEMQSKINSLRELGAHIGKNVFIGYNVFIETENAPLLYIENNVVIAAFSKFILHDSSMNNVCNMPIKYAPIILKENCYIGADCLALPGSTVGANTIVGAGSIILGKLRENSVYFGRIAKYHCSLNQLKQKWQEDTKNNKSYIKYGKWYKSTKLENINLEKEKERIYQYFETKYKHNEL